MRVGEVFSEGVGDELGAFCGVGVGVPVGGEAVGWVGAWSAWCRRAILLRATSMAISGARVKVSRRSASKRISSPCSRKARL